MSRTERVALLVLVDAMPDLGDVLSWTVDGRVPSADEVRLLKEITPEDAQDVVTLWGVARDVTRDVLQAYDKGEFE